ncbi:MAG: CDP-alcohol phosphatidyltransferase family protein [Wenzhouxiangellaceae bacterium]|nr:CDP-alcohol phosphatidyltransferase family protein [Wenzhouxiangellaceae bacterium]
MTALRALPNLLTAARIVLVLPLAWLLLDGRAGEALALALVLGLSDWLDGALARRYGWQTELGGVLDPLADKILLLTIYAVLTWQGDLPVWLLVLAIVRDVVIVAGALAWHVLIERFHAEPTRLSKFNTLAQLLLMWVVLLRLALPGWLPPLLVDVFVALVACTLVGTFMQYVTVWGRRAWQARHGGGGGT